MGPIAINLPPTVSCHQFGLGLGTKVLLKLVTVGYDLPWLIRHQPMIIILINMYSKKENVVFHIYMCLLNDSEVYKEMTNTK